MENDPHSTLRRELYDKVVTTMKERGYTHASLGEKMGVTPPRITQMLNDGRVLTGLLRIAQVLEIPVNLK